MLLKKNEKNHDGSLKKDFFFCLKNNKLEVRLSIEAKSPVNIMSSMQKEWKAIRVKTSKNKLKTERNSKNWGKLREMLMHKMSG